MQTYKNWELIIVDDCSTDNTLSMVEYYCNKDKRIKRYALTVNCGAAVARNKAIKLAKGKYLAFLDSDDLWKSEKLEKQLLFMEKNKYYFTCTAYGKIDEHSNILDKVVKCCEKYNYELLLRNCFGNSTVIYDAEKLGKIYGENIRKRNDFVMWLKAIKVAHVAYGFNEILGYHRIRKGSISHNKGNLIKYQWYVYRHIENLSFGKCFFLICYKVLQSLFSIG